MTVFFKREPFHGFDEEPMWHVLKDEPADKYGLYVAVCGYQRSNVLGGIKVSRAKKPKKPAESCAKCVAALSGKPIDEATLEANRARAKARKPKTVKWVLNEAGEVVQQ